MTSGNGTLLFVVQIMSDLFYKLSIVYTIMLQTCILYYRKK